MNRLKLGSISDRRALVLGAALLALTGVAIGSRRFAHRSEAESAAVIELPIAASRLPDASAVTDTAPAAAGEPARHRFRPFDSPPSPAVAAIPTSAARAERAPSVGAPAAAASTRVLDTTPSSADPVLRDAPASGFRGGAAPSVLTSAERLTPVSEAAGRPADAFSPATASASLPADPSISALQGKVPSPLINPWQGAAKNQLNGSASDAVRSGLSKFRGIFFSMDGQHAGTDGVAGSDSRQAPARSQSGAPTVSGQPVARTVYAKSDGTDILSNPSRPGPGGSEVLSQTLRGQPFEVIGETPGYVHGRSPTLSDYNPKTNRFEPTEVWLPTSAVTAERPSPAAQSQPQQTARAPQAAPQGSAAPVTIDPATAGTWREAFVRTVRQFEGTPYRWGGTTPGAGVDCSGLVVAGLRHIGFNGIPRTARDQQRASRPLTDASQLRPGDLIFDGNPAKHVVIYMGNGQTIEAMNQRYGVVVMSANQRIAGMRQRSYGQLGPD
ncbi:MAG: C40 family peptidase [Elusimicrobia bacterium]|nr:C40 family peptidase [Elusimicrobiota bacterium]